MISLIYSKIISEITNSLVSYISKLEDLKYQYQQSIDEYKKLNELYDNITFDIDEFVEEYNKSKNSEDKISNNPSVVCSGTGSCKMIVKNDRHFLYRYRVNIG